MLRSKTLIQWKYKRAKTSTLLPFLRRPKRFRALRNRLKQLDAGQNEEGGSGLSRETEGRLLR